jgi:hypothetical protein
MRFALMRLGTRGIGCGLGRCCGGRLSGRAGRIGAVYAGRGLGGIAAQIPAFGLFDRISAVVPVAARRRLSGGCWQTGVFRPHGMSAHAASSKNNQSTQNGKRSCFRQFPLASHVIASPSNHRPSAPTRRYSPRFRTGLKNIAAKTCYPGAVSTIFLLRIPRDRLAQAGQWPISAAKTPFTGPAPCPFEMRGRLSASEPGRVPSGFWIVWRVGPRHGQDALELALVAARNGSVV